jgi:triacylglycerol lipase
MSPLGLVEAVPPAPEACPEALSGERYLLEDTLASARRLWIRGRLPVAPCAQTGKVGHWWWPRWRDKAPTASTPASVSVQTRVSGFVLKANAAVGPDGRFDALIDAVLPPTRRGWRIARNQVTWGDRSLEGCNVILGHAATAEVAILVCLPVDFMERTARDPRLTAVQLPAHLSGWLRTLHEHNGTSNPLYYLTPLPPTSSCTAAELALAVHALGWPPGQLLLLPADREAAPDAVGITLERLRQLFAETLPVEIVNLEPLAVQAVRQAAADLPDRARVRGLFNVGDDPEKPHSTQRRARPLSGGRPTRSALVPRYPVVFCHGMLAVTRLRMCLPKDLNCFSPLADFLRGRGFRVLFPQVPATSGVRERAAALRDQIRAWTDEPVNLIAHSMGGLDARYLIGHLGMAERVQTLTTVSTPHHGTALAEWFLSNYRERVPLLRAFEAMGINVDGFRDCLPASCQEFNTHTPDDPRIRYFSYAGAVRPNRLTPVLRRPWSILTPKEGANDGMVSVRAARWGEFLGVVAADHFAQTPDATYLRPGEDFDCLAFYSRLVEDLARRGY